LRADTITGTVKDPSGAVVAGAKIEITGGNLTQPLSLTSDDSGKFSAPDLSAGKYSVRVTRDGFEDLVTPVDLQGTSNLQLVLKLSTVQTNVVVTGKSAAFYNSDPVYRQLRDVPLNKSFHCENFRFNMDVASFELKSGTLTFLAPVNNLVTGAVF